MSDHNELGILARRKIEAEIIKPIYDILVREIGKARAQAVIGEAIETPPLRREKRLPARSLTARIFAALSRCSICGRKIMPWRSRCWTPTTSSITTT